MSGAARELREVRLLDFPLDAYQRATEAFEGLRREFTLVALRSPHAKEVPARLLELVDGLTGEFGGLNDDADRIRDAAIARGETSVDELVYRLPVTAADACVALADLLDEADEFCRQGDVLLTLASPPEMVAFRRWYLGEVVAQVRGGSPLPWPDADAGALLREPRLRGAGDPGVGGGGPG